MSTHPATDPPLGIVIPARLGFLMPLAVYVAFAWLVYVLQGPEPTLSIDHISYFKLADEIRAEWPRGDYWRTINSVRSYGVLLAYFYDLTGSHVTSLKLILAAVTVGSLAAFHVFMSLLTPRRSERMLFAILSALFVSFGASIWGMTDFAASLNRTIIIPFVILLAWFFLRWFHSPWRYAIYPALTALSLLHLSALHVILVFFAFEALDFAFRRRFKITRDIAWFALACVASIGVQALIEWSGGGTTSFIRYTLKVAMPQIPIAPPPDLRKDKTALAEEMTPGAGAPMPEMARDPKDVEKMAKEAKEAKAAAAANAAAKDTTAAKAAKGTREGQPSKPAASGTPGPVAAAPPAPAPAAPKPDTFEIPVAPDKLSIKGAWDIELFAFPWRNMPPSIATLATIATSFGVILLLAILGAVRAWRTASVTTSDRVMVAFAGGTLLAAYGLQTFLWLTRGWLPIFPVNFEEIRAVNMLMLPALYFLYRLYQLAPPLGRLPQAAVRALIVAAFVLQPILLVRALPTAWREGILETAISSGLIKRTDTPRVFYARHFLGLSNEGRRFYYSARGAVDWLVRNASPKDLVLTNVDDFIQIPSKTTGNFLNVMTFDVWDRQRGRWIQALDTVDKVMATRDAEAVRRFGRKLGATYAVVTWPVPDAVYRDEHYSIIRVN